MLHEDRQRAESFGAVAELYDRARPSYPPAVLDAVLADEPRRALDVACGTGIVASLLVQRGCQVLGVEIDPRMAAIGRAKGLDVEVASFETWADGGRRFELLTCGQGWHWIEPGAGVDKAATVLTPGARLAVFWNYGQPGERLRRRLADVYDRLAPGLDHYSVVLGHHDDRAPQTVRQLTRSGAFADVQTRAFPWARRYDAQQWVEHLATHSDHQRLPPDQRAALLHAIGRAIEADGGSFELPYQATLVTARRR